MQTIFVMIKCRLGETYDVASAAVDVDNVSEVHSVSGQYDLMLKCFLPKDTDIGHYVTEQIQTIAGIKDTFTLIAFKTFS